MKNFEQTLMEHISSLSRTMAAAAEKGSVEDMRKAYEELSLLLDNHQKERSFPREEALLLKHSSVTVFDKTKKYDIFIRPRMEELSILCNALEIPYFASFCTLNDEFRSTYLSSSGSPGLRNIVLSCDEIRKHELVAIGMVFFDDLEACRPNKKIGNIGGAVRAAPPIYRLVSP